MTRRVPNKYRYLGTISLGFQVRSAQLSVMKKYRHSPTYLGTYLLTSLGVGTTVPYTWVQLSAAHRESGEVIEEEKNNQCREQSFLRGHHTEREQQQPT